MRVEWTELAFEQLDEAMAFIARDRPETAARWFAAMLAEADHLSRFPDSGRVVPEASRDEVRDLVVSPYRIVYRRDPKVVYITMFLHERQHVEPEDIVRG